jgi:hypothetical protein
VAGGDEVELDVSLATMASIALALAAVLAVIAIMVRPSLATGDGGRTFALVAIAVLPAVATTFGMSAQLEASSPPSSASPATPWNPTASP